MHLSLIFFFKQPAVLDNLLGSMKYVLTGMGLLRINLENPKNRVRGIMYHVPTMSSYVKCFNDVQFIQTNRITVQRHKYMYICSYRNSLFTNNGT